MADYDRADSLALIEIEGETLDYGYRLADIRFRSIDSSVMAFLQKTH